MSVQEVSQGCGVRLGIKVEGKTIDDAYIMVPMRTVAEALGFAVTQRSGGELLDNGRFHTLVTIGEDFYLIVTSLPDACGARPPLSLGIPPCSVNGTTYVPLRLFYELLRFDCDFDIVESDVEITQHSTQLDVPDEAVVCLLLKKCVALTEVEELAKRYNLTVVNGEDMDFSYLLASDHDLTIEERIALCNRIRNEDIVQSVG